MNGDLGDVVVPSTGELSPRWVQQALLFYEKVFVLESPWEAKHEPVREPFIKDACSVGLVEILRTTEFADRASDHLAEALTRISKGGTHHTRSWRNRASDHLGGLLTEPRTHSGELSAAGWEVLEDCLGTQLLSGDAVIGVIPSWVGDLIRCALAKAATTAARPVLTRRKDNLDNFMMCGWLKSAMEDVPDELTLASSVFGFDQHEHEVVPAETLLSCRFQLEQHRKRYRSHVREVFLSLSALDVADDLSRREIVRDVRRDRADAMNALLAMEEKAPSPLKVNLYSAANAVASFVAPKPVAILTGMLVKEAGKQAPLNTDVSPWSYPLGLFKFFYPDSVRSRVEALLTTHPPIPPNQGSRHGHHVP